MIVGDGLQRSAGFTLIEVLAAITLTSAVVGAAAGFYINLSQASSAATALTREGRHAAAILDRVARDLEGAYLLEKPEETDPLDHPWVFLAENHTESDGADRLKFMTRSHRPSRTGEHTSDLTTMVYQLRAAEDYDGYELLRWATPHIPPSLDRSFPGDDENALVLADGLASFALRFLADGEWVGEWDSSTLIRSSTLPLAVEIELALLDDEEVDAGITEFDDDEREFYRRRVVLPLRAIPLQAMLDGEVGFFGAGDDPRDQPGEDFVDEDGDGRPDRCKVTWGECMDNNSLVLLERHGRDWFNEQRGTGWASSCADDDVARGTTRIGTVRVNCR